MQMNFLKQIFGLLDIISSWANYRIYLGGPDHLALPLGLLAMMLASLLILIAYSVTQREPRKQPGPQSE
jgi:hypothetical protein